MSKVLSTKLRYKRVIIWQVATERRSIDLIIKQRFYKEHLTPSEKDELLICSRITKANIQAAKL